MALLLASLLALAFGPLVHRMAGAFRRGLPLVDGFVLVTIAGLVLLKVVPETVGEGGWIALVFAAVGLLGPTMLEHLFHRSVTQTHALALGLALVGLALHANLDGAALIASEESLLPIAVVLHRLPVGLVVWWLVRPAFGAWAASGVLALVAVNTLIGYTVGPQLVAVLHGGALAWFEAMVAGALLHVVFHSHPASRGACESDCSGDRPALRKGDRFYEGAGGLAGVLFLSVLLGNSAWTDEATVSQIAHNFLDLALESAPALVLAYVMAGLVGVFLPQGSVDWMSRGGHLGQSARGMLVGLPFPVCSCGVVPLYRAFVTRGVPASAGLAFLVATPELGLDAVLLSIPLLGIRMTLIRLVAAAIVALAVGWFVGRLVRSPVPATEADHEEASQDEPFLGKLREGLRMGLGDLVDQTAAWILLGITVAAAIQPFLGSDWLRAVPGGLEVLLFAVLGMPTYVCASGATPLVAVLLYSGVSPGAALAFLLTGPATNFTTLGVLSRLHGTRVAVAFGATMIAVAVGLGYAVNALVPTAGQEALQHTMGHEPSFLQWISLGALALIFASSLLRMGVRRFFVENLFPESPLPHGHPEPEARPGAG